MCKFDWLVWPGSFFHWDLNLPLAREPVVGPVPDQDVGRCDLSLGQAGGWVPGQFHPVVLAGVNRLSAAGAAFILNDLNPAFCHHPFHLVGFFKEVSGQRVRF